jgi:hypothetical protein
MVGTHFGLMNVLLTCTRIVPFGLVAAVVVRLDSRNSQQALIIQFSGE